MNLRKPIHANTQFAIRRKVRAGYSERAIAKELNITQAEVARVLRPPRPLVSEPEAVRLRRMMKVASAIKSRARRTHEQEVLFNNFGDLMPEWTA